jgi:nicotinamide phosphoribosyltransferase
MDNKKNLLLNVDSYKMSHYMQYPPKTTNVFSYIEARKSDISDKILFFGLQAFIKEYLSSPITKDDIIEAKEFAAKHGVPFNEEGWQYILDVHDGFLPLRIRGVDEGLVTPLQKVLVTVENTDEKCFWLTSYIETALLRGVWYPSSVATISFLCKKKILESLLKTSDYALKEIDFKLHDFGARGVNTEEGAMLGGMAHLLNFKGTDTISGILGAMKYYNSDVCGYSIPAAEHSTITAWGQDGECAAYKNMVAQYAKKGATFAVVADSYDIFNAINNIWCGAGALLDLVESSGATVVIRPDSGDPTKVPIEVIELLMKHRGFNINSKGYKVLPDYVRVIQGDGINLQSIGVILDNLEKHQLSASNIAFGMGGGLLQQVNRDTFGWAMKCSAVTVNGNDVGVCKNPSTDASKRSKKGRLTLVYNYYSNDIHDGETSAALDISLEVVDLMKDYYYNRPIEESFVSFEHLRQYVRGQTLHL